MPAAGRVRARAQRRVAARGDPTPWRKRTLVRSDDEGYPDGMSALDLFSPATREWFERAFAAPTPAQEAGWPAIASGEHTLIQAPTGSGKTLAAFLYGIDRLNEAPCEGLRLLYVLQMEA